MYFLSRFAQNDAYWYFVRGDYKEKTRTTLAIKNIAAWNGTKVVELSDELLASIPEY
jgi:hypothetical protein